MTAELPPVVPSVTAELVEALSPRLRKRLDAGIAKLAGRPVTVEGDTVRVAVDDETDIQLALSGGVVGRADAIRCGCLLAPDCLHRAAVASLAPIAEKTTEMAEMAETPEPAETPKAEAPDAVLEPVGADDASVRAARAVFDAAAAVLDAGTDGAGAVLQAELLRAAHGARLAGLHRVAGAAVSVVNGVRAARGGDAGYRLADLQGALREVLGVAYRLPAATDGELAVLRGRARQSYTAEGSLRLYGLFSEPVLTATGYAGVVTWVADADGRLYTVSDVAPGGVARAAGAVERTVRLGDTALTHRELASAGLAVSGATVSPTGRLGAGAKVRAVRAGGVGWEQAPLDALWEVPVGEQVARALGGEAHDLLFLDVTIVGTVRETGGDCLLADCGGVAVRLGAAHEDPGLPCRDNLRVLAGAVGAQLRVVGRLVAGAVARVELLAVGVDGGVGVGVERLRWVDLEGVGRGTGSREGDLSTQEEKTAAPTDTPADSPADASADASADTPASSPSGRPATSPSDPGEAPLYLLQRRLTQAVTGGRRVLAVPGSAARDVRILREAGLGTAGDLLHALDAGAAERGRDVFGRLLPADTGGFARAWLAGALYGVGVDRTLCAAAWGAESRMEAAML
ncbi:hypothetical protein [Streptomyces sp. 4F14]|uniref:hypothetical protein n=1 Tax=Streptomyces sp. 4F14 TaxID=3394380 RepID=UPI003A85A86E